MESGHSVLFPNSRNVPHPPLYRRLPPKVYSTLGKLIDVLEQLKPSEDLRSLLHKLVAEVGDKSPSIGSGSRVELDPGTVLRLARILARLNAPQEGAKVCGQSTMNTVITHGTIFASSAGLESVSDETSGPSKVGGERVTRGEPDGRSLSLSKQDSLYLMKKIRDFEHKCKPLQEKNKKFLERNMELTTLNRNLREQMRNIAEENKKIKEQLDETRRKCSGLSRQLIEIQSENENLKFQIQEIDRLRKELAQNAKTISALKQAAAEKDRRMEVLQHRKKRRLRLSPEYLSRLSSPCSATDDECSQDSDLSISSVSPRNLSDIEDNVEELREEELEKIDKSHRKLMKEHLALQKSTAKLQSTLGWGIDPERYVKTRLDFETDLYVGRCKVENLEECLEKYKDSDMSWTIEKEELSSDIQAKSLKISTQAKTIEELRTELLKATTAYEEMKEQSDHLEFLVLETQENNRADVLTEDATTNTEKTALEVPNHQQQVTLLDKTLQTVNHQIPNMNDSVGQDGVSRASIKGLEEKLTQLMKGEGSGIMIELRQAGQNVIEVIEVENTMQDLQGNISNLQQENIRLNEKLVCYRERLDSQEQSLSLTRDEREELLQVKLKYLEETEAILSIKVTELDGTNHILKQRLDVKDELLADVQLVETLTNQVKALQAENNDLESKLIDLEENNYVLKENWRKVADEEADRRECLEEKVRVLESVNKELKTKIKDQETDLDLSVTPSIASEINEDVIEELNERIKELEDEINSVKDQKDKKIESLKDLISNLKENEAKLSETLQKMENNEQKLAEQIDILEKSKSTTESTSEMLIYNDKLSEMRTSHDALLERLNSMERLKDDFKERMIQMEKLHAKKIMMQEHEIAELQQQEDDLYTKIKELEENENVFNEKLNKWKEMEMNYKNKIEQLENRETSLTIQFSQRVEELEQNEKNMSVKFDLKIEQLESNEENLKEKVKSLQSKNKELIEKVNILEKHEKELSEKVLTEKSLAQENLILVQSKQATNGATSVIIQETFESVAIVESEASVVSKTKGFSPVDYNVIVNENQKLREEMSKLQLDLEQSENVQKSIEEKLKRQEKKRKRSERSEKSDDYDSIARKVVTYEMEVEQLRGENSDLHERLMELDESEKTLQEENEKMERELNCLKQSIRDYNLCSEREQEVVNRISELETVEQNLMEQSNEIQAEQEENTAAESESETMEEHTQLESTVSKETVDVSVGTDDFMEGVMAGHEQGKPVSSMFERIQILENENNDLSTKLSTLMATDAQVRQLSDKVKNLEENEDSLMERVMELEEEEDRLKRELIKVRNSVTAVDDLEAEIAELHEKEAELNNTMEILKLEKVTLMKAMECSDSEKGGIAVRLASVQKMYEDEKKKVESLLKSEERLMKSMSSEKKKIQELEDELSTTQEKLEELQTEYEHKLTEKDESEKVVEDEFNKLHREKQVLQKKLNEFEKSNSELEDEIEHCKISESRMFHRLQTLNTQNEEMELKLSKLVKLIPHAGSETTINKDKSSHLMSENPEVISENPLSSSIFTEKELDFLRSKTPELDLLGSVPLDMLRKMKDFDQREKNYLVKIQEIENKNIKLQRKMTLFQSKEKDLKHEIKELQLESLKFRAKKSKLKASNSSLDMEKSGSNDSEDNENQSAEDADKSVDIFNSDAVEDNDYDNMTQEELLLSVKLLIEKQNQDTKKIAELEKPLSALEKERNAMQKLLEQLVIAATCDHTADCLQSIQSLKMSIEQQDPPDSLRQPLTRMLNEVTGLRQRLEALQDSEETLRLSLAENEVVTEQLREESSEKIKQLEAQIHVLAKVAQRHQSIKKKDSSCQSSLSDDIKQRYSTSHSELHLEPSKTIKIDVPPSKYLQSIFNLQCLEQSEVIHVNISPERLNLTGAESDEDYSDTGYFGYPESSVSAAIMEKAEDVLRQRIRELEKLEKHLRQQVSDLESDREDLHDIARKDKTIIHQQNVALRQLELAQRNLQEQVKSFEKNENSLYARLDELEADMDNKDDRIRDLEILEDRLKDLVKQYKLDEKILKTNSETLESSVKEMSQKEETLRQKVQNLETEKTAFSERSEYLQLRLKELEGAELDLADRAKNQENILQTLQKTVIELETYGANAHARVIELEYLNFDMQQRLHHTMTENSPLSKRASAIQKQCNEMESELTLLRDLKIKLRQENESLVKCENSLQHEVKRLQLRVVELESQLCDLEKGECVMKDRLGKLQRSENTLKYRVKELESSGNKASLDLNTAASGSIKLPRTLEECQRRIIVLQTNNAELQSRLLNNNLSNTSPQDVSKAHSGLVSISQAEYQSIQRKLAMCDHIGKQLSESDRLNIHLQGTITQLREGKDVCGHEVENEVLRQCLDDANSTLKMLQNQTPGQWYLQGQNVELPKPGSGQSQGQETVFEETMAQTSAGSLQNSRPPGRGLSRDALLDDLLGSLHLPSMGNNEDKHWHEIEARMEAARRGGEQWISVGKATSLYAKKPDQHAIHLNRSHGKDEELELNVALQSETESQNYLQNDTDSCRFGNGLPLDEVNLRHKSELYSSVQNAPSLPRNGPPFVRGRNMRGADSSFVDSLTVQDSNDEISDQQKDVVFRRSEGSPILLHSVTDSGRGTASVSIAASTMTLHERIQHVEKQLSARESDSAHEMIGEMDMTSWKALVHESNRRLELTERENKHIKEEINRLEKDLEEKTRLHGHLEAFLHSIQNILANKDSLNNKEVIERIEHEVNKVVSTLADKGRHPDNIMHDPAALSTELAKRDRELAAKRNEANSLLLELRQWQEECRTIEEMRKKALDSLRGLEVEVAGLQQTDSHMQQVNSDYHMLKGQFLKLVDAYKNLENVQHKFDDLQKKYDDLDIENSGLRSRVNLLEGQIKIIEETNKKCRENENKVLELQNQLVDYEKENFEKKSLEKNLEGMKELLNERMRKVESLTEELFELRKKISTIDRDNYKLRQSNLSPRLNTFNTTQLNQALAVSHGNSGSNSGTALVAGSDSLNLGSQGKFGNHGNKDHLNKKPPLGTFMNQRRVGDPETGNVGQRTCIVQLTNLCSEKDMLIKNLVQELRKLKSGAPLVEELEACSDHDHNHLGRSLSQNSLDDSIDRMSVVSDTELLHETSPSLTQRPRSADIGHHRNTTHRASYHGHSSNKETYRPHSAHHSASRVPRMSSRSANYRSTQHSTLPPHLAQSSRLRLRNLQNHPSDLKTTRYVAVADYDPSMFSQSGHPKLDLPLKEGDIVLVTGPIHNRGYVEGEARGRVGLVPLSYLQPCSPHRKAMVQRSVPGHLNASPERIAQLYQSLHNVHVINTHGFLNGVPSCATDLPGNRRPSSMATSRPDTPGNFHVEKIISNNSLMLAWQPVDLDNSGCNNGVKVTGYKIYKNNKLLVQPSSRHASKAIIENISIQQQHRFSIKTVCVDGRTSDLSELMYEGVEEVTSEENSDTESEMDMAHVLNVDEYKTGQKRVFMGVYDYDPSKNSPYEHPTCELAFNAGDIITVYGRQRGDGFYYAELNGVRGLVPTFFIEEMPQPPPRTKKIAARNKQASKEKTGEKLD